MRKRESVMFRATHLLATVVITATVVLNAVAAPPRGKGGSGSGNSGGGAQHQTKGGGAAGNRHHGNGPVVIKPRWQIVPAGSAVILDRSGVYGVMLTATPEGAAAAANLKTNDVIITFGGFRTASPDELDAATGRFAGQRAVAVFLDGETGEEKSVFMTPAADGSIGASVQQVRVK
jgi:hypothetical protein